MYAAVCMMISFVHAVTCCKTVRQTIPHPSDPSCLTSLLKLPKQCLWLQDAPRDQDQPCLVTAYKPGQGGCCLRCHYIHRGSFKSLSLVDLETKLNENSPLQEKILACIFIHGCRRLENSDVTQLPIANISKFIHDQWFIPRGSMWK